MASGEPNLSQLTMEGHFVYLIERSVSPALAEVLVKAKTSTAGYDFLERVGQNQSKSLTPSLTQLCLLVLFER